MRQQRTAIKNALQMVTNTWPGLDSYFLHCLITLEIKRRNSYTYPDIIPLPKHHLGAGTGFLKESVFVSPSLMLYIWQNGSFH